MTRRVVLYTRQGCHLCDEAYQTLQKHGLQPELVDIDADEDLRRQHDIDVPVVEIDGKIRFRGRVNEPLLRRLLQASGGDEPNSSSVDLFYRRRLEQSKASLEDAQLRIARIARGRAATFLLAVAFAVVGWATFDEYWLWRGAAVASFAGFVALVAVHEKTLAQIVVIRHRRDMRRTQLARLQRRWRDLPEMHVDVPARHRAVARDLDLTGHASLFQFVSLAHTPFGIRTLRDWLLEGAAPEEIRRRQEAVALLAGEPEFQEELDLRGRLLGAEGRTPNLFLEWAEGPPWLTERPWLKTIVRVLPLCLLAIVLVGCSGLLPAEVVWGGLLLAAAANLAVSVIFTGTAHDIFDRVSSSEHDVQHYRPLFEEVASLSSECEFFDDLKSQMGATANAPALILDKLLKIVRIANLRHDGLFGLPYLASQLVFLTDFHVLSALESWQQRHGGEVRKWLEAVAQLEAVNSLAALMHDHPDWTLPNVARQAEKTLQAKALGHPLLPDDACVRNDVEVGPAGTFLLVTGSNMSGKSTLLRAIGLNAALAQAGGPACARELVLPPVEIATSMRVDDSLSDGVSFFMAELKRLKQIVDQSDEVRAKDEATLLYLLDEILQGTNSRERHIAVSKIIHRLVEHGAIGAVSTHDLELAASDELKSMCRTVHFRETIEGEEGKGKMTFDYQMHEGVAPTTNALRLLEIVGLGD